MEYPYSCPLEGYVSLCLPAAKENLSKVNWRRGVSVDKVSVVVVVIVFVVLAVEGCLGSTMASFPFAVVSFF